MNAASPDNLMPRPLPGRGTGLALAVLAHALLVLALALGLNWRVSPPTAVEAELWAEVPRAAAPRAVEPPPTPEPPKPEVKKTPEPRATPPAPREAQEDAQIAVEKARREKKEREEREDREQRQREEAKKKAKEEADKAAEKLAAQKAAKEKELAAQRKAQEEQQRDQERTAAAREAQLKRIQGLAGGSGAPTSSGTSPQSGGPSANYAGRISARIKSNIVFSDAINGNPATEIEIRVAPDGRIMSQKLVRSSGVKAWDDAVQRAIERTEMLPRDVDGRVPPSMQLLFRPQD